MAVQEDHDLAEDCQPSKLTGYIGAQHPSERSRPNRRQPVGPGPPSQGARTKTCSPTSVHYHFPVPLALVAPKLPLLGPNYPRHSAASRPTDLSGAAPAVFHLQPGLLKRMCLLDNFRGPSRGLFCIF